MSFQVLTAGVFPSVDLLGTYTLHDNKILKRPREQTSVTLKMDTATPSKIRSQLLSYPVKQTQKTTLKSNVVPVHAM
jgi:hypothetical protein